MAWRRPVGRLIGPPAKRETGRPTSSNGASSTHLFWEIDRSRVVQAVSVDVEVLTAPTDDALHFWALQVGFADRSGTERGAGHFGLQHHPRHHPGGVVNWGGYRRGGGELPGSESRLASSLGNVNSRDYHWVAGRGYRYRIAPAPAGGWRGSITDLTTGVETVVRDLWCEGDRLVRPMVWSEVFARCEGPPAAVRWSHPRMEGADGRVVRPSAAMVNYQKVSDGGCTNTTAELDSVGIIQRTATERLVPTGSRLPWP